MTAPLSRRAVTSGLAWSVPAIAAATAAPSFAASFPCTRQIDDAFAAAQAYVRQNYLCDGQPVKRQLNFFQPAGVGDSVAQQVYVSVKHLSPCNVTFSPEYPLQLDIQVRNNTVLDDVGRSVTRFATSWGSGRVLSYPMNNKPVGSVNHDFDWAFSGTLPGPGWGTTRPTSPRTSATACRSRPAPWSTPAGRATTRRDCWPIARTGSSDRRRPRGGPGAPCLLGRVHGRVRV